MYKTPFKDINTLLEKLSVALTIYFKDDLVGMYLYGSLAWGDFNNDTSDLDILVVLKSDVNLEHFSQLKTIHHALIKAFPIWHDRIEIAYVSLPALQNFKKQTHKIAVISPGEPFHIKQAGTDWLINFYCLQNNSIVLLGSKVKSMMPLISQKEFISAVEQQAIEWRTWIEKTKDSVGYQYYAVLTICRAFYVICKGEQVSKLKAATWMKTKFKKWAQLIDDALLCHQSPDKTSFANRYSAVSLFVHEIINLIQTNRAK